MHRKSDSLTVRTMSLHLISQPKPGLLLSADESMCSFKHNPLLFSSVSVSTHSLHTRSLFIESFCKWEMIIARTWECKKCCFMTFFFPWKIQAALLKPTTCLLIYFQHFRSFSNPGIREVFCSFAFADLASGWCSPCSLMELAWLRLQFL